MTGSITDFISGSLDYRLSPQAVHGAKRALIDCIGVMLAGSKEEVAEIACHTYFAHQTVNAAPVFGRNFKTEPTTAALLNGISAHALDYDDSSETMYGHPSASVVPACLALASTKPVSGRDFLLAYITGIEVASKMSLSVPGHYDWGWHNSSTLGSLGAAAACARLLLLDSSATGRTLGIAASLASGIKQNFGTMTKPLHMGNAARNGVLAALLAERGFTSDADALGGPQGFCKVFSGGGEYTLEKTLHSLGNPWEVADPGIRIKLYPCCTSNHRPVESVILIAKEYDIDPGEIARVDCGVIYKVPDILIRSDPHSGVEAKFSLQYCVARALISRKLVLSHFDTEQVLDPLVRSLMKKVSMYVHKEGRKEVMTRQFAETSVTMKDSRVLVKRVYEQEGHPSRPLTDEQVCLKFKECASRVFGKASVSNILDLLWNVETLPNMDPVLKVLDAAN